MALNSILRRFLQQIASKQVLPLEEAQARYLDCAQVSSVSDSDFQRVIAVINNELEDLNFKIEVKRYDVTGMQYVAFVNRKSDSLSAAGSSFSPEQTGYLIRLLQAIIYSSQGMLSLDECLLHAYAEDDANEPARTQKTLSLHDAQEAIELFKTGEWLVAGDNRVTLGPRAQLELGDEYAQSVFGDNEEFFCSFCHRPVFMNDQCSECGQRVHRYCMTQHGAVLAAWNCPKCQSRWRIQPPQS
eukprot:GCRY01005692.1.p1 GENE.GCRY01005692.1~~GCRY01005692.1.p1  ORF type:complete len:243 (+),score=43.40 GCRY01005692.1:79-807(+)